MKYHIVWNEQVIASFLYMAHRNQLLAYWKETYPYSANMFIAKDDV